MLLEGIITLILQFDGLRLVLRGGRHSFPVPRRLVHSSGAMEWRGRFVYLGSELKGAKRRHWRNPKITTKRLDEARLEEMAGTAVHDQNCFRKARHLDLRRPSIHVRRRILPGLCGTDPGKLNFPPH